jgi:hypothetical protein
VQRSHSVNDTRSLLDCIGKSAFAAIGKSTTILAIDHGRGYCSIIATARSAERSTERAQAA